MRAKPFGPRYGCRAYNVLEMLYKIGGRASLNELMSAVSWDCAISRFQRNVMEGLVRDKLVEFAGLDYVVTAAGIKHIGAAVDAPAPVRQVVAGPRQAPSKKPLDLARHRPVGMVREGSLSYRDIPSLMAGERVAYGSKA